MDDIVLNLDANALPAQGKKEKVGWYKKKQMQRHKSSKHHGKRPHGPPPTPIDEDTPTRSSNVPKPVSIDTKPPTPLPETEPSILKQKVSNDIAKDETVKQIVKIPKRDADEMDGKPASSKPHQVISSLFTYNPDASVPESLKPSEKVNYDPSNGIRGDAQSFDVLGLHSRLCKHLSTKLSISKPTPVQQQAIPYLISPMSNDRDVIVQAQTGMGKTLSYVLPLLHRLISCGEMKPVVFKRTIGTVAVVMCPTRELVTQVHAVLESMLSLSYPNRWIVAGTLTGGEKKKAEKARLRKGVTILVTTPGRLLDHLKSTLSFDLCNLRWVILDEADRFIELGAQETVKEIMALLHQKTDIPVKTPKNKKPMGTIQYQEWPFRRQLILCSATVDDQVKELGGQDLRNPLFIHIEMQDENAESTIGAAVPNQLEQRYAVVPAKLRLVTLASLLAEAHGLNQGPCKTIVFFSCCDAVDFYYDILTMNSTNTEIDLSDSSDESSESDLSDTNEPSNPPDLANPSPEKTSGTGKSKPMPPRFLTPTLGPTASRTRLFKLHGNIAHQTRLSTFSKFTQSSSAILLATDVAARGLDLPNVTRIVQFDPPSDVREYVHRVGRTARLGKTGEAIILVQPSEVDYLGVLKEKGLSVVERKVEDVLEVVRKVREKKTFQEAATEVQHAFEKFVVASKENGEMAKKAYLSTIRAYATHNTEERHIFHVKKLHLGHMAKAFAMREAPSQIKIGAEKYKVQVKKGKSMRVVTRHPVKRTLADEFAGEAITKKPKTQK